jgi:hypothetical protein
MKHKALASLVIVVFTIGFMMVMSSFPRQAWGKPKRKPNVIRLETMKVEGRVRKPQAFYILQRSNLNYEGQAFRHSLTSKIVESIERSPF